MSSINNTDLFEQYYQNKYDYNTNSLNLNDIDEIKILVREKRVDYAQAPIGTGIFSWILKQSKDIRFELVAFDSEKIDGMLYIPTVGKERAYIILNANKPLANQIFAAAHEFYHYAECRKIGFTSDLYIIPVLKIGKKVLRKSGIRALSEIGAHGFACTYLERRLGKTWNR